MERKQWQFEQTSHLSFPYLDVCIEFTDFYNVTLSTPFVFVNCASISAFISDPVFNVLFYIPEGNSPLDHCLTTVS